jgi:hypothetical protein
LIRHYSPSRLAIAIKNDFSRLNANLMVAAGRLAIFKLKETRAENHPGFGALGCQSEEVPHGN